MKPELSTQQEHYNLTMPFLRRPALNWSLRTRQLTLGRRTLIAGILNVTPDSFSDGGHFYTPESAPERAVERALTMLAEGADILDVGGESTRPNAIPITAAQEQERILPVIEAIRAERPDALLSIDTYHAATARSAIEAGAEIVNDVSGLMWDREMAATCAELHCGVIVMHARGRPQEWRQLPPLQSSEVVPMVLRELGERVQSALHSGIERERIVIDPGVGFGKRGEENYPLLARIEEMRELDLPVMVGVSRKGFLGEAISPLHGGAVPGVEARVSATTAANVAAILGGAHLLRVHDVLAAAEAAAVADKILAEV